MPSCVGHPLFFKAIFRCLNRLVVNLTLANNLPFPATIDPEFIGAIVMPEPFSPYALLDYAPVPESGWVIDEDNPAVVRKYVDASEGADRIDPAVVDEAGVASPVTVPAPT